jgi:TonB family protein
MLLFLLLCFQINAQNLKRVTQRLSLASTEVFYIDKKTKIREGAYDLVSSSGYILVSGYYSSGNKDSIWMYYSLGRQLLSKQDYKNGNKIGVWEFYNDKGLSWTYDFDSLKSNFFQPEDTAFNKRTYLAYQDEQGNWVYHPPEKHALPISSEDIYIFMANLRYPEEAQNNHQQGESYVAVLIDEQGNPINYEIGISSGYPSLDAEALRVIKLCRLEYIPAENKGIKVKSLVLRPVHFRLEN